MHEEDSHNPYAFLRAGLSYDENMRSDHFDPPNLDSLVQKQDSSSEELGPISGSHKELIERSAK